MVGKFNTRNCKGSVKDLLGFPPKQKLLFLFGRMYSSMFPCQVECWSGIMHSLGMTDHVLRLGGAGLLGCVCGVSLLCGSLKRKQTDLFSSPLPLSLNSGAGTSHQETSVWQHNINLHQSYISCGHYPLSLSFYQSVTWTVDSSQELDAWSGNKSDFSVLHMRERSVMDKT